MSFVSRIYFNAVFGALGGLLGWLVFGVFGDKNPSRDLAFLPAYVTVHDLNSKTDRTIVLVGPNEASRGESFSTTSPMGQGLLGKTAGEVVEIPDFAG